MTKSKLILESCLSSYLFFFLVNSFIYDPNGRFYSGTINRAESGKPCQPWRTLSIALYFNYTGSQFADQFIPGAVCRNPIIVTIHKTSPWCFTNVTTLKEEKCYLLKGGNFHCKSLFKIFLVFIFPFFRLFDSNNFAKDVR